MRHKPHWQREITAWAVMVGLLGAVALYVWATEAYREHHCHQKGLRLVVQGGAAVCVDSDRRVR